MSKSTIESGQLGGVVGNRPSNPTPVPRPDGQAILRGIQTAVDKKNRADTNPKARQNLAERDWRKG